MATSAQAGGSNLGIRAMWWQARNPSSRPHPSECCVRRPSGPSPGVMPVRDRQVRRRRACASAVRRACDGYVDGWASSGGKRRQAAATPNGARQEL